MKVLYVVRESGENPYVNGIAEAIHKMGAIVKLSVEDFYGDDFFDVIHIHWPEAFTNWEELTSEKADEIKSKIIWHQSNGTKIVYTCHNLKPHQHFKFPTHDLYSFLIKESDAIIHLGKTSRQLLGDIDKLQKVIPHQIYSYQNTTSQFESRDKLGIDQEQIVILVFGKIRSFKEQRLIIEFFKKLSIENKFLLVPRWNDASRPLLYKIKELFEFYYLNKVSLKKFKGFFGGGSVSESEIQTYFNASDIVLLPRVDSLNSGIIPLAYSFKKAVVGFNNGNMGDLLRDTDNFVISCINSKDEIDSISKNLNRESLALLGQGNYEYAQTNWDLKSVTNSTFLLYKEVCASKS